MVKLGQSKEPLGDQSPRTRETRSEEHALTLNLCFSIHPFTPKKSGWTRDKKSGRSKRKKKKVRKAGVRRARKKVNQGEKKGGSSRKKKVGGSKWGKTRKRGLSSEGRASPHPLSRKVVNL